MKKLALALTAFAVAGSSVAGDLTGKLAGFTNDGTGGSAADVAGSVAVAIISDCRLHNALQIKQIAEENGIAGTDAAAAAAIAALPDAVCIGDRTKACAPTISSAELRTIVQGSANTAELGLDVYHEGAFTALGSTNCSASYTANVVRRGWEDPSTDQDGVQAALNQFMGAGSVGGFQCGPLAAQATGSGDCANSASPAALMSCVNAGGTASIRGTFGLVHANELDGAPSELGFIKLDGAAPDLVNSLSGNYNLMSNVIGTGSLPADASAKGMTVGVVPGAVVYHALGGSYAPSACGPLTVEDGAMDVNGGGL